MNKNEYALTIVIQMIISFVAVILIYDILNGHVIISFFIGLFIGALYHGLYEEYSIRRNYNNGICKKCNTPYTIQKRWYVHPQGVMPGYEIETAICNNCKIGVPIPGIRYK